MALPGSALPVALNLGFAAVPPDVGKGFALPDLRSMIRGAMPPQFACKYWGAAPENGVPGSGGA